MGCEKCYSEQFFCRVEGTVNEVKNQEGGVPKNLGTTVLDEHLGYLSHRYLGLCVAFHFQETI